MPLSSRRSLSTRQLVLRALVHRAARSQSRIIGVSLSDCCFSPQWNTHYARIFRRKSACTMSICTSCTTLAANTAHKSLNGHKSRFVQGTSPARSRMPGVAWCISSLRNRMSTVSHASMFDILLSVVYTVLLSFPVLGRLHIWW